MRALNYAHMQLKPQTSLQSSGRRAGGKQQQLFFSNRRISPFQHPATRVLKLIDIVCGYSLHRPRPYALVRLHLGHAWRRARGEGGDGGLDRGWCLVWSLVPRSIFWERDIGTKMSAGTSSPPRNFCERLPALCELSSFIDEHEQWIDSLLQQLGWQRDSLSTKVINHRRDINQHARGWDVGF